MGTRASDIVAYAYAPDIIELKVRIEKLGELRMWIAVGRHTPGFQ